MAGKKSSRSQRQSPRGGSSEPETRLRIIGGSLRGRRLLYHGDPRTRPMKDRVREAVFNLLGRAVQGTHAVDLFAGTGALGLEAISRGAASATLIEQHFPTARVIEQNVASLQLADRARVVAGNVFCWVQQQRWDELPSRPWTVFCSPPYEFYVGRIEELQGLLRTLYGHAPAGSWFVVESDRRFDFACLADFGEWDVRTYPPAVVGIVCREV
jgi:16S rRNA (guanine966-N2)-methyltransferase